MLKLKLNLPSVSPQFNLFLAVNGSNSTIIGTEQPSSKPETQITSNFFHHLCFSESKRQSKIKFKIVELTMAISKKIDAFALVCSVVQCRFRDGFVGNATIVVFNLQSENKRYTAVVTEFKPISFLYMNKKKQLCGELEEVTRRTRRIEIEDTMMT